MAKEKISASIDATVLIKADLDAKQLGLNRSELIERALLNEHLRIALENYTAKSVPALGIDDYAATVYDANRKSGL
ncbi:MAG: antitoxin [Hamadaea sp.]|nr:antitoxin [Hamadaea sp.]